MEDVLSQFMLGGVSLGILTMAVTEALKYFFDLDGKSVILTAFLSGFVMSAIAYGLQAGLLPADVQPYIEWFFTSLVGGLAAIGAWRLGKRFILEET